MHKVIAIDGPSGAGKSTLARLLAESLRFDYLDTGALYRGVAVGLVRKGIGEDTPDEEIAAALRGISVAFVGGKVYLDSVDVSGEIRTPEAGHFASVFSARRPVREYLLKTQRDAAMRSDIVCEGRDMTTVVFPEASVKFFLDASVEERARRRTAELLSRGFQADEAAVRREIAERDQRDSTRDIAPLRKADDARVIDSTGVPIEGVLEKMLRIVRDASSPSADAAGNTEMAAGKKDGT